MKEFNILRTCALLHDIGKLECWANQKPWSEHTYFTYKFVKTILGEKLATCAMRHHVGYSYSDEFRPKTNVEKIIYLADNLASGTDRTEEPHRGIRRPKSPIQLTHILSDGRKIMKEVNAAELAYAAEEIRETLREYCKDFEQEPAKVYLRIYNFLENYDFIHRIPANTRGQINDVSLWEHVKLTAAFSTCIWLDGGYRSDAPEKYLFCLLSGDADKVSTYVSTSSRLPDLHARSTRIKRATMEAGHSIKETLGPECLVYSGGGGFLALCPKNEVENVSARAKEAFEKITEGEVTITMNYVSADGRVAQRDFGNLWNNAMHR